MQQSQKNNYRSIIKSSAIFGGTQVFMILINLIRGKIIAVFLGPAGMGISALLLNTTNMIQQFSSCGVNLTVVKDVAQAEIEIDQNKKTSSTLFNIRLLMISLGLVGSLISLLFAKEFSIFTFGNSDYILNFRLLSIFIFLTTVANGEMSILQGKKQFKKIAFGSIVSSISALLVGLPFYYFLNVDGIVPAMLVLSFITVAVNIYLNRDNFILNLSIKKINFIDFSIASKRMISLGGVLMIAGLLGTLSTYLLNIFITKEGGVSDVGYFQSANSMTNQYIGLVFTAMSIDYFPRLAAISGNKEKINELVNRQLEIVLLFIAPVVTGFIVFSALAVKILLSSEFLVIVPLLNTMALGSFFKAASYPLGYISFAKGDQKIFFWMEGVLSNLLQLSLNVFFYYCYGLEGLGFSFIIIFIVYLFIVSLVTYRRYQFQFELASLKLMIILGLGCLSVFFVVIMIDVFFLKYILAVFGLIIISSFCIFELDKRIGFFKMLQSKFIKG